MAYERLANSTPQAEDVEELVLDEFLTELPSEAEHELPSFFDWGASVPEEATHPESAATPGGRATSGSAAPPRSSVIRSLRSRPLPPPRNWDGAASTRAGLADASFAQNGSPQVGDNIAAKYQIEQVLGRSNSEVALLARHLELDSLVLLRMLLPEAARCSESVAQFQRAARHALERNSEHLEQVIDYGRLGNGCPYRVAELPRGPALSEVLETRGALPMADAVDTLLAACEAVAEFHCLYKVHGHLSTSSLFVEQRTDSLLCIRLVDFGVLESLETEVLRGRELALPGTSAMTQALPGIAPERIRNPASVDHRADIWTLGTILYEMLAGRPAFQANGPLALLAMIAADDPAPLTTWRPEVPETLVRTVQACLQKEPWLRPQTALDLITLLMPFASQRARAAASRSVLAHSPRRESAWDSSARRPSAHSRRPSESPTSNSASATTLLGHAAPSVLQPARATRSSSAPAVPSRSRELWLTPATRRVASQANDPWRAEILRQPPLPHSFPRRHAAAGTGSLDWSAARVPALLGPRSIAAELYSPALQAPAAVDTQRAQRPRPASTSTVGRTVGRIFALLACVSLASLSAAALTRFALRTQSSPLHSVDSPLPRVFAGTAPHQQPPSPATTPLFDGSE